MKEAVIVSGSRTAIGTFGGGLKDVPVTELGAGVMKDVLKRVNLRPVANAVMTDAAPDQLKDQGLIELEKKSYEWNEDAQPVSLDEVIMGNVLQAAQGQNTARQAMIGAGISKETPAGGRDSGRRAGKYESGSNGIAQGPLGSPDGADRSR
jgi:acetyl-CoA C-acetyltransferase